MQAACLVIVAKLDCPMDPSDKRVFRRTKNCRIEKLTSTTVVSVGSLTSYGIDQSICSNSKLSLLKSEVSLRFLLMAKFLDNVSCFLRLLNFGVVSILGRSFTSLAGVVNIVHTFVCGDNVGASTINANELISDGAVNFGNEGINMCKFSAYVEFSAYFYLYPEAIPGCDSLQCHCNEKIFDPILNTTEQHF